MDDMVRTGSTIAGCCSLLKQAGAARVLFVVTHFYSSDEVKENLNHPAIDEIITTNTLPSVLNRDMQGRLRRKMLVLKIEKWIASFCLKNFLGQSPHAGSPLYSVDMSSKNPRWRPPTQTA
jgi:ribose-phosphate pyrophosphokinase